MPSPDQLGVPATRDYIVCFGNDQMLLLTRQHLLQRAGYVVLVTSDEHTVATCLLNGGISVLILCHTLSYEDMELISSIHREMRSTVPILCLSWGNWQPTLDSAQIFQAQKGPAAFVAAVQKLSISSHHAAA